MSIRGQIDRINANITSASTEAEAKGATMPVTENCDNLADTVASIPQGSAPALQSKTVTPTTSQQSVMPDSGYDGLSDVTVNATPLEAKTVTPTSQQQVVTPTAPNIGLSSVTVGAANPNENLDALLNDTLVDFSTTSSVLQSSLFLGKQTLQSVSIPNVNEIPGSCFTRCSNIKSIIFSNNLINIGDYALKC